MSSRDFKWRYKYLITITIPVSSPPSRFFLRSSARGHLVIPLTRRLLLWLNLGVSLLSNWNKLPHSFIHSGHFYSAPSSPLLLRGAPDYSTDTVSEFHAEAH